MRAVLVTYRFERRRLDESTIGAFRARGMDLLKEAEELASPYPDLRALIADAREELERDAARSPGG